jgi:uncharacterized protein (DUF2141 family)
MQNRSRYRRKLNSAILAGVFVALAPIQGAAAPATAPVANTAAAGTQVSITVTSLRSAKGVVRACLTSDRNHFPKCAQAIATHELVQPASQKVQFAFAGISPGYYAVALLHDENNNGKIDRALLLMPKEGYGFSRDAPVRMGPPKFDAAAFAVGVEPIHQTIQMRYML